MQIRNPILKLALPSVVTNITVPLLGLVDMTIVGHMGSAAYIGAVAIGTTIFNMVYWLFAFLRMGTTGVVSQAHGAGDNAAMRDGLLRSLLWGVIIATGLLILQTPLLSFSLWLMAPEPEIAQYAETYFRICIWGAPAMLASYSLTGWFIGMQDTHTPMWIAILQNLLNITATSVFVFLFGMDVDGVALGTVVGLYGGCLYAAHKAHSTHKEYMDTRSESVNDGPQKCIMNSVPSVYVYLFLRTLCLVAVTVYFTTAGSHLGALYLDANSLLMQFFIIYSYFTDGLANAAEALSGKHAGAKNWRAIDETIRQLFLMGFGIAFIFMVLYMVAGGIFLSLLTNQQEVLDTALPYLPWVIAIPLVASPAFVWDGIYIGLTATRDMFRSMFVATLAFFAMWFLFGPSNHALWFSFLTYLFSRSLMQTILFQYRRKNSK